MNILSLNSVKPIERQFATGEEPVLVMCSDMNTYICKYMRSSASAYKLACEYIGSCLAQAWNLTTPSFAFVRIHENHWRGRLQSHVVNATAIGSQYIHEVLDITPNTYQEIPVGEATLRQLLKIALFDFWIANEDRNANNANLIFDVSNDQIVSIDYGCIFNTATFEYPLSQLTSTDTILWSDLFQHIKGDMHADDVLALAQELKEDFKKCIEQVALLKKDVCDSIPSEWHIPAKVIEQKLHQLLEECWTTAVWDNFMECLKENIGDEE